MVSFPEMRLRRVRELEPVRVLTRETRLSPSSFIYPLFVTHGQGVREPIEPMPGCNQRSPQQGAIGGVQIFQDKTRCAPCNARMVAAGSAIGQAEAIGLATPQAHRVGKGKVRPNVATRKYFEIRHSVSSA